MIIEFGNRNVLTTPLTIEEARKIVATTFGTDFLQPCFYCGVLPAESDIWRIDRVGGVIREGHSKCFPK
jgi:hypothetical protein